MKHFKDFLPLCLGHPRGALTHPQLLVAPEPQSSRRGPWEHSATCWGAPRSTLACSAHPQYILQARFICPLLEQPLNSSPQIRGTNNGWGRQGEAESSGPLCVGIQTDRRWTCLPSSGKGRGQQSNITEGEGWASFPRSCLHGDGAPSPVQLRTAWHLDLAWNFH